MNRGGKIRWSFFDMSWIFSYYFIFATNLDGIVLICNNGKPWMAKHAADSVQAKCESKLMWLRSQCDCPVALIFPLAWIVFRRHWSSRRMENTSASAALSFQAEEEEEEELSYLLHLLSETPEAPEMFIRQRSCLSGFILFCCFCVNCSFNNPDTSPAGSHRHIEVPPHYCVNTKKKVSIIKEMRGRSGGEGCSLAASSSFSFAALQTTESFLCVSIYECEQSRMSQLFLSVVF